MNIDEITDMIAQMGTEMQQRRVEIEEATMLALALRKDFDKLLNMVLSDCTGDLQELSKLLILKWR